MEPVLNVKERLTGKRSELKQLRNQGLIPGIVYGKNYDNVPVSVGQNELQKQVREHGRNSIYQIELQGKKQKVMIRDVQTDKVTNNIIHVDFLAVDEDTEIEATISVNLVGEAEGIRDGGVLQQLMYEINIVAKAEDIPEKIDIDISELNIGDTITIEEVTPHYPFTINHPETDAIVTILPPQQTDDAEADAGEEEPATAENPEE